MNHSIIITHRNRQRYLMLCLWALGRAAARHGPRTGWEVVIVDNGSDVPLSPNSETAHSLHIPLGVQRGRCRVITDPVERHPFNKPALTNLGIDAADGDALTFLDCDAIVGPKWFHNLTALQGDPAIVRLCYRGRYLPIDETGRIETAARRNEYVDSLFANYDDCPLAWEAYREPDRNLYESEFLDQVYGNSQFSVTREKLGDLRMNEEYDGRGMEDVEFARQFARKYDADYRGYLNPDPNYSLFLLAHPKDEEWADNKKKLMNARRYKTT